MEGVMEVGRYFILHEVQEVGSIPIGHVRTTQLVTPLNSHLLVLLHSLALILMAFFPCFFRSSAVFRKLGEVLKEEVRLKASLAIPPQWLRNNADLSHTFSISFSFLHFILFLYLCLHYLDICFELLRY
jgi:hypothetical protein